MSMLISRPLCTETFLLFATSAYCDIPCGTNAFCLF
ncbi:hypothetical protein T11_8173 [Trichinella zimbabwensis]|uniref:Uncharacterized protein n=1 Tax=Trichinella zimbabwensis TaxID=268475 RepID=A0A0V1GIV8_9BILA|nr:hypothetical protein T11_6755 [Trichinella zimbabwensis]KRY98136.1 hypothetical protein T11_8173 [Trichinella zimbabwensis]